MEMKQQKTKTSMYKDIIKLKILFLMWVPLLSYGQVKCEDLYKQVRPLREKLNLVSSSKKIKLLSKEMEENRKINGGYAYAYVKDFEGGPVKIRYADYNIYGPDVKFLNGIGKERSVTKRQVRGIKRYDSTARDFFEPLDKALHNRQMPKDRYIVYKGQDAKIIDVNNDSISIMIFDHGYKDFEAKEDGYKDYRYGTLINLLDSIVPSDYWDSTMYMHEIRQFDKFLEKGGSENWVVSYKNSEGKRAYGEIERVNHDELYLKNIKLGKIEKIR